jgi:hypothetical protein
MLENTDKTQLLENAVMRGSFTKRYSRCKRFVAVFLKEDHVSNSCIIDRKTNNKFLPISSTIVLDGYKRKTQQFQISSYTGNGGKSENYSLKYCHFNFSEYTPDIIFELFKDEIKPIKSFSAVFRI